MIGNDIIDINETKLKTNWQRQGFLNKIFTDQEQELINEAKDSFLKVWRLWSIKESAYKANMQYDITRKINPTKIECRIINSQSAIVNIGEKRYIASTLQTEEYIYSYASEELQVHSFHSITNEKSSDILHQSISCRNSLIRTLSEKLSINKNEVVINKSTFGQPQVYHLNKKLDTSISLTHHGKYSAYSIVY